MKNIKRNKIVLGSVIGLGVVALATVGFSSWIINISNDGSVGQINVAVADVVDKTVTISEAKLDTNNNTFNFGPTASGTIIKPSQATSEEDMTFAITYKVTTEKLDSLNSINATLDLDGDNTAFSTAITNNYIVPPIPLNSITAITGAECVALTGDNFSTTVDKATSPVTCTTTFTFKWGTAFGSMNPANYVTTANQGTELTTVKTALQELYKANGAKLKITLSSTVA